MSMGGGVGGEAHHGQQQAAGQHSVTSATPAHPSASSRPRALQTRCAPALVAGEAPSPRQILELALWWDQRAFELREAGHPREASVAAQAAAYWLVRSGVDSRPPARAQPGSGDWACPLIPTSVPE